MTIALSQHVQPSALVADGLNAEPTQMEMHRRLARLNRRRLRLSAARQDWRADMAEEQEARLVEAELIEAARAEIADWAAEAPADPDRFLDWFEGLEATGPGQGDPLFPWLRDRASREQIRWFLRQEVAGEAGFDDLVAYVQVKMPQQAKLELARNYWDEMGRGNPKGMHGPMLERLARHLGVASDIEDTVWEALALANTMLALATNRRYAYQAVGALGVIELTAPGRSEHVAAALERIGVPVRARHYFELHAVLDRQHSRAWNAEILRPLAVADPSCARLVAEGALIRLKCGARCFARYRAHLWDASSTIPAPQPDGSRMV